MNVAFGFKAHSGWAALVVIGVNKDGFDVLDRRRVELAQEQWAKQPYHSAEQLESSAARKLVQRGIHAAQKHATREVSAAVKRAHASGHQVLACGVLVGADMPEWSVDEILAVHFRMHKAEGVLFRESLAAATFDCGLRLERIPEKNLVEYAEKALNKNRTELFRDIAALGKRAGAPWGKDQKEAALAAMIALSL